MPVLKESAPSTSKPKTSKPSTQIMVDNALKTLNDRTGSSFVAIKKFIASTYNIDAEKSSTIIKKYIKQSLDSGKLVQTKGTGISGSVKLSAAAKKKLDPKPKPKESKPKKDTETKVKNVIKLKKVKNPEVDKVAEGEPLKVKKAPVKKDAVVVKSISAKKDVSVEKDAPPKKVKKTAPAAKNGAPLKKPVSEKKKLNPVETVDTLKAPKKKASTKKTVLAKQKAPPIDKIFEDTEDLEGSDESVEQPLEKIPAKIIVKKMDSSDGSESSDGADNGPDDADDSHVSNEDLTEPETAASSDENDLPKKAPSKKKGKADGKLKVKRKSIATLARAVKPTKFSKR